MRDSRPIRLLLAMASVCCLTWQAGAAVGTVIPSPRSASFGAGTFVLRRPRVSVQDLQRVKDDGLAREAYVLSVSPAGIVVRASAGAGFFYALKTLEQLSVPDGKSVRIPCCEISDEPKFAYRGFMLDESRHFFGADVVKRLIDRMSRYKLNVLHWHLTDGNGWRLAIDAYPELTKKGATRRIGRLRAQRFFRDVKTGQYGPYFYTKDEIRDIVAYARRRNVRIVPEIEFPGHEGAAIESYPALYCFGDGSKPQDPSAKIRGDEICLASGFTFEFFANVLKEVCELFPGEFVHVGGDECMGGNWQACAKCRAKMAELGFKTAAEYQAWGVARLHAELAKHGKRLIGWDPVFTGGGLPSDAAVMSYRGIRPGINAAQAGHDVVMAPAGICYLDFPQGLAGDPYEYQVFSNPVRAGDLYAFNPLFAVPKEAQGRILGGECPLWTEFVCTEEELDWRVWPRLCAFAEALWTAPDPKTVAKTAPAFLQRLEKERTWLKADGANVAPLGPLSPSTEELLPEVKQVTPREGLHVILNKEARASDITFVREASVPAGECELTIVQTSMKARVSDAAGEAKTLEIVRRLSERKRGDVTVVRCGVFRTW